MNVKVSPYLYKEKQIRVLALWCRAGTLLDMVVSDIDTLHMIMSITFYEQRWRRVHHLGCCRTAIFAAGVLSDGGLMNCAVFELGSSAA